MSKIYKSAKGKMIDIDKVKLANEDTQAVGNMRVNARGDLLGDGGAVATPRNQLMDRVYAVEASQYVPPAYSPNDPGQYEEAQAIMDSNKAKQLHDLANNLIKDTAEEPVVEKTPQAARGSLASSVAKSQTVTQQPLPNPKKSTGPSRI